MKNKRTIASHLGYITAGVILAVLVLASGCSKNTSSTEVETEGDPVVVKVDMTRSGLDASNNEGLINRARIMVFKPNGDIAHNHLYSDTDISNGGGKIKIELLTGRYQFHVLVNEPAAITTACNAITNESGLAALRMAYTPSTNPYIPAEFPAYGSKSDIATKEGSNVKVELRLLFAKVTVKVNIDNALLIGNGYIIPNVTNLEILSLPKFSYVRPIKYTVTDADTDLRGSEKQTATIQETPETGFDKTYKNVFYIPEFLLIDATTPLTRLVIRGQFLENSQTMNCVWEKGFIKNRLLFIGDAMDDAKQFGNFWNISRGMHYHIDAKITGLGEHDLLVKCSIVDWEDQIIDRPIN